MRRGLVTLLSLVFLPAAYVRGGIPQSPNTAGLCAISGTVINASTRQPIRKAQVQIQAAPGGTLTQTTLTTADGRFEFINIPPGRYLLVAEATGYVVNMDEPSWMGLTLAAGEPKREVLLPLFPEAVISGRVYDEDGDPVQNAMVWAFVPVYSQHRRRLVLTGQGASSETNERGEYRLYNLSPGRYTLVATYQRKDEPRPVAISPTFYPNASDPEQAAPVKVGPGDELTEINFYLQVTPAVCVRGKATVQSPSKTPPAFVELLPQSGWALPWIVTNARYMAQTQSDKGDFQICGVPPGSYLALAGANDRTQENIYRGRSPVEVGSTDLEGVNISVDPEFDIRGRLQCDPAAQLDLSRVRVQLQSQDRESSGASAQVSKDGAFVIHHVADASYSFAASGFPPEFYLKSARLGGADLLASGLIINYGMFSENLEVVLSPNGGRVDGSVLSDDAPAADAEVVSVPDEAHRHRDDYYRSTRSDSMGKFTILGLPPGDFTLYAFEKIGIESFKDPDFFKRFAGQGTTIHIEEQKQQSVQLNLIHKSDRTD